MSDHDHRPDPIDRAYLGAEDALDDEAARAARRARLLAAVAQDQAASAPPTPSARRPVIRQGGWLVAAGVAGLSVWTAVHVYKPAQRPDTTAQAPAKAPAPALQPASAPPPIKAPAAARALSTPAPIVTRSAPAPITPPPDLAPPPPLPIPPVPAPIAAAPPPPPPAAAKPDSVVVTASRMARRSSAIAPTALNIPVLDAPALLRAAAAAGRTSEIENWLTQGVAVDSADADGETALMKSVEGGHSEAVTLLLRHGADRRLKNRAGLSASDMATQKHDPAIDRALGPSD